MKLIEAMKQLKVIEKRMAKNVQQITKYASIPSNEKSPFGTEDQQKKEVRSLLQSNNDLTKEYLRLKNCIDRTNLNTTIQIDGISYTLVDLLTLKRKLANGMINTYEALNDSYSISKIRGIYNQDKSVTTVYLYDEEDKNNNIRKWQDLADNIESRLEVINATTDLVE